MFTLSVNVFVTVRWRRIAIHLRKEDHADDHKEGIFYSAQNLSHTGTFDREGQVKRA
jgi:hypothetical protein